MPHPSYLIDTNILLRLMQPQASEYSSIRSCMDRLWQSGAQLCYASQNLVEFWNVCTRPIEKNGLGLSISETNAKATLIEAQLTRVSDSETAHMIWRKLVVESKVSGVQVHDARLAATMLSQGITHIFALNGRDFHRYSGINVVSPDDLLTSIS